MKLFRGTYIDGMRVNVVGKWAAVQVATPEEATRNLQAYFARSWALADETKLMHFGIVLARRIPLVRFPYRSVISIVPPYSDREERLRLVETLRRLGKETNASAIAWGGDARGKNGKIDRLLLFVQQGDSVRSYHAPTQTTDQARAVGPWTLRGNEAPPPDPEPKPSDLH